MELRYQSELQEGSVFSLGDEQFSIRVVVQIGEPLYFALSVRVLKRKEIYSIRNAVSRQQSCYITYQG
jgi:hypothetical protein